MILIKVLTKTKYLSFHFVFNCTQRGFVCSTRPLSSPFPSHTHIQQTWSLSIQKIQYALHLNMQNAKREQSNLLWTAKVIWKL